MKRSLALLCAAALMLGGSAFTGPAQEALTDGRSRYVMDVTLDGDASHIAGTMSVTFMNDSDAAWEQVLFSDFIPAVQEHAQPGAYTSAILSVTDGEGEALAFDADRAAGLLTVDMPAPLGPGQIAALTVDFEADVPRAEGERFQAASFPDSDGVTVRLCQFYPMLCPWRDGAFVHHPYEFNGEAFFTECSDYSLTLRLPEAFAVAASGQEELVSAEDGTAVWQITGENMRDMVVTASTEFAAPCTGLVNGVTVRSWGAPQHSTQAALSLQAAMDAITLFQEKIGPFPYDELDICAAYMPEAAGGIEYPGLIEIIQVTDEDAALYGGLEAAIDTIVPHEVAHQWFYAAVGNDQYDDPFLDESFASYCELLYREYVLGETKEHIAEDMQGMADLQDQFQGGEPFHLDLGLDDFKRLMEDQYAYGYSLSIYQFGRAFLWQVQQTMGDEAFFAMLSGWYEAQRFQTPTTQQFVAYLTAATDGDPAVAALIDRYMLQ